MKQLLALTGWFLTRFAIWSLAFTWSIIRLTYLHILLVPDQTSIWWTSSSHAFWSCSFAQACRRISKGDMLLFFSSRIWYWILLVNLLLPSFHNLSKFPLFTLNPKIPSLCFLANFGGLTPKQIYSKSYKLMWSRRSIGNNLSAFTR